MPEMSVNITEKVFLAVCRLRQCIGTAMVQSPLSQFSVITSLTHLVPQYDSLSFIPGHIVVLLICYALLVSLLFYSSTENTG